jgi:Tol biopolymer transport system component
VAHLLTQNLKAEFGLRLAEHLARIAVTAGEPNVRNTITYWGWCIFVFVFFSSFNDSAIAAQLVSSVGPSFATRLGGSADSELPVISGDGRYVLFASTANNLTFTNDNYFVLPCRFNVYLRDTVAGTTTLVSVNQAGTGGGNGDSFPAGISTNGQFALFESSASDLVANDTNNASDIFVRDVVNGTTTLVSVNTGGGCANGTSRGSVMTPDGQYVAFVSAATNLVFGDTNGIADIFIRDLHAGTTTLVSLGAVTNSNPPVRGIATSSESPEITPDGRYVAFLSAATNLVHGVTTSGEIYVRDLVAGNTIWASTNARAIFQSLIGGTNVVSCNYSISDDGQFVAFEVCTNPVSGLSRHGIILRYSLTTGLTDIINTNAIGQVLSYELIHDLSITPDGRFVAYVVANSTTNSIYCWDSQSGTNTLVSVSTDNSTPANGMCDSPVISTNGQVVVFTSTGNNLVTNPLAASCDVYVRDLQAGSTMLLDTDANGTGVGVDATTVPAMSADGSVVAFDCANLLPDNRHLVHDVYTRNIMSAAMSLVSAANPALPSQTPDGISGFTSFSVSSSGQFAAFYSDADNLVAGDTNGYRDVFLRDLVAGTNYLVSVNTNGNISGDGISTDPAISGDGRYVAFTSSADDLVVDDTNRAQDVFIRDMQAGTTALVSVSTDGVYPGNGDSYSPILSADGRYVLFRSKASNLAAGSFATGAEYLFFRDLQTGVTYPVTMFGISSACMTPDGQSVAFINNNSVLYVWNSQSNALTYTNNSLPVSTIPPIVAISPHGQKLAFVAGSPSGLYVADLVANTVTSILSSASIQSHAGLQFSDDGRFLAYAAAVQNSLIQNVYLYDSLLGTNVLVSRNFNGTGQANTNSDSPTISPDGRFVAYRSFANNIVPFDFNNDADLFLYDVSNNATILISVNTAGNASADDRSFKPVFTADGQMLLFQSWASDISTGGDYNNGSDVFAQDLVVLPIVGTTNATSNVVVQLTVPSGAAGFSPFISWPLSAGISYQVQYKTNLTDAVWLILPGDMTFIGATGWLKDSLPSSGQRFYRIALTPMN